MRWLKQQTKVDRLSEQVSDTRRQLHQVKDDWKSWQHHHADPLAILSWSSAAGLLWAEHQEQNEVSSPRSRKRTLARAARRGFVAWQYGSRILMP